jgi:hypothetical protein
MIQVCGNFHLIIFCYYREEWEWLHKNSTTYQTEVVTENEFDENGLSLFKTQFQDAAKDLCLMLSKLIFFYTKIPL